MYLRECMRDSMMFFYVVIKKPGDCEIDKYGNRAILARFAGVKVMGKVGLLVVKNVCVGDERRRRNVRGWWTEKNVGEIVMFITFICGGRKKKD